MKEDEDSLIKGKVSMFYGSYEGADISVVNHTFVESCKLACISVTDFCEVL